MAEKLGVRSETGLCAQLVTIQYVRYIADMFESLRPMQLTILIFFFLFEGHYFDNGVSEHFDWYFRWLQFFTQVQSISITGH